MKSETDTPEAGEQPRRKRMRLVWAVLIVSLLAGGWWLGRDLPRWAAVQVLSTILGADVELEALRFEPDDKIVLDRLQLRDLRDFPTLEAIEIDSLALTATWRQLLRLRWPELRARGILLVVDPSRPFVMPPTRVDLQIDQILLEAILLRLHRDGEDGGNTAALRGEAEIRDYGRRPSLEIIAQTDALDLRRVLGLVMESEAIPVVGLLENGQARWVLDLDGSRLALEATRLELERESVRARLRSLQLSGETVGAKTVLEVRAVGADIEAAGQPLNLPAPALNLVVESTVQNGFFLEGDLVFDGVENMVGSVRLDASGAWHDLDSRVEELDLTALAASQKAPERLSQSLWLLDGEADLRLLGAEDDMAFEVDWTPAHWPPALAPYFEGKTDARVRIKGTTQIADPQGSFDLKVDLPDARGQFGGFSWPKDLFPAHLGLQGEFALTSREFRGEARFRPRRGGQVVGKGSVKGGEQPSLQVRWTWSGSELATLRALAEQAGGTVTDTVDVDGFLRADGEARGPLADPNLNGQLQFESLTLKPQDLSDWVLYEANGSLRWHRRSSTMPWSWRLLPTTGGLTWRGASVPLAVEAAGTMGSDLSLATFDGLRLDLEELGTFRGAGTWTSSPAGADRAAQKLEARLQLDKAILPNWLERVEGFTLEPGSHLQGNISGDWEVVIEPPKGWRVTGLTRLEGGGYASPDGARVVDGLGGQWELHLAQDGAKTPTFAARGAVGGFQLLWNTFYGDFSTVESELDLAGRLEPLEVVLRGSLPEGPRFETSFTRSAPERFRLDLELTVQDLKRTHERYLQPLLAEALGGLTLAGELDLEARLDLEAGRLQSAAGRLSLRGLNLTTALPLELEGLSLDLPFDVRRGLDTEEGVLFEGPALSGRLRFDRLSLRDLNLPAIDSPLTIEGDAVALRRPLEMATLGGKLALESLTAEKLLGADRAMTSSLRWSGVRLELLAERLELMPLEGELEAYLPRIRLNAAGELDVTGGGEARLFGGSVLVREISGRDLFTRFPKMAFSADFERLDLAQLTRRFDFGEMSGLLSGTIEDAELFRGVPTAFAARFATVREKGVKQRLDLKAVKNLTVLGTGSSPSVFDRGLLSFFDTYRYAGFGFSVRLVNDALTIRGLEKRGTKQLFLRGRLPLRIDIVNAVPKAEVSFRGMLDRLRNLDVSAIQTD